MPRKRLPEEPESHERWLMSYADFITLLFAFFVVMYAISQVNESKYRVLSDSLVQAFQNPSRLPDAESPSNSPRSIVGQEQGGIIGPAPGSPRDEAAMRAMMARMRELGAELSTMLDPLVKEGLVRVSETRRGLVIEINASVLFRSGQSSLEPAATKTLSEVARVLARTGGAIAVEGHTDNVPISTPAFASNWELSASRAAVVVRLFVETGIAAPRLTAIGHADNQPIEPGDTPEARARNRRVAVIIQAEPEPGQSQQPRPAGMPASGGDPRN
ncbi:MAG: flagellar motor protein MotD [Rhodocyclaceae bacterium]|jgi:chemotaxis protein MotB|nr:flagellar motor protein MotD [Rhodocyclaceae bacterium]MCE2981846.1 flagellar motor protein MotD [Betaproteobacteria bacterium]MCA3074876.1 flagellar motor protein MotD [Rhodocyclaceae bacterium]MCA3089737.1 flagellar motor protein MotD [Rhodocyclaceae bacterium]MCA3094578.1 flagellar motor protein MotD [Rhodocyclaceae bacterium]